MEILAPGFAEFRKAIVLPAEGQTNITLGIGAVTEAVDVVGKPHALRRPVRHGAFTWAATCKRPACFDEQALFTRLERTRPTGGDLFGLSVMNQSVDGELAGAAMDRHIVRVTLVMVRGLSGSRPFWSARQAAKNCAGMM